MRSCLGSLSGKTSSVEHFNFHFFPCVCWSLWWWMFQIFHWRFQTNNCIIFYMWWLKKVKNSTVYLIRKFCTSITDCIFIITFWAQVTDILINDNLQCMMQVVYLHELRKIRLSKNILAAAFQDSRICITLLVTV